MGLAQGHLWALLLLVASPVIAREALLMYRGETGLEAAALAQYSGVRFGSIGWASDASSDLRVMSARSMGPGPALVGPRSGEPYATMSYLGSARSLPTRMLPLR